MNTMTSQEWDAEMRVLQAAAVEAACKEFGGEIARLKIPFLVNAEKKKLSLGWDGLEHWTSPRTSMSKMLNRVARIFGHSTDGTLRISADKRGWEDGLTNPRAGTYIYPNKKQVSSDDVFLIIHLMNNGFIEVELEEADRDTLSEANSSSGRTDGHKRSFK